jgi:hypothetical protein
MIFLLFFTFLILVPTYPLRIGANHFTHYLQKRIDHNLQSIHTHFYSTGHDEEIPDKVFNDLKDFVSNDT